MNPVVIEVLKQIIIAIAGITIVGATVATGTMGASNLVSKFTEKEHTIAQVHADEDISVMDDSASSESNTKTNKPSGSTRSTVTPKPTAKPGIAAVTVTPTTTPSSVAKNVTGCIVTLFGQQYNVSTLQQSHSGGNIFNCGTDMSSTYQGKHGSNVSRMQQYLVSAIGTGGTVNGSTGASGASGATGIQDDDDREEDEQEDEEREEEMKKVLESAKKELEHEDD